MSQQETLKETVNRVKKMLGFDDYCNRKEYDYSFVSPNLWYVLTVERVTVKGDYIIYKKMSLDRFTRVLDDAERKRYIADYCSRGGDVNLNDYGEPFSYEFRRHYKGDDGRYYVRKEVVNGNR